MDSVVLLSGGTGGAKLARGLADVCDQLTVVANTADDVHVYGVHVSPDPDLVTTGSPTRSTSAAGASAATPGR
jgi:2-phospho-L-lactate transferase/gluconeogenesis factor (CofD/UPF0052 family)